MATNLAGSSKEVYGSKKNSVDDDDDDDDYENEYETAILSLDKT
jgi:hypothetical protein